MVGNAAMGAVERGTRKVLRRVPVDRRTEGLAALALTLARSVDAGPDAKDLAALAGRLQPVLAELAKFEAPGQKGGTVDDLNARRQKRRGA